MLFKIVTPNDIEKLSKDIQQQLKVRNANGGSVDNIARRHAALAVKK
jgi:hypothetical protein